MKYKYPKQASSTIFSSFIGATPQQQNKMREHLPIVCSPTRAQTLLHDNLKASTG